MAPWTGTRPAPLLGVPLGVPKRGDTTESPVMRALPGSHMSPPTRMRVQINAAFVLRQREFSGFFGQESSLFDLAE